MSGLIAAGVTALGALGSAGLNAASQARTNAQNREQAEYAFRMQQQAIREANAYNAPNQQVARLMAAGLNPSLAYGADGALTGQQSDVPAYNPIPAEAPNVGRVGSELAEAVRTGIEVKDMERRQALAVAEMALQDAQTFLATTQGELNQASKREILDLLGYRIDNLESQTQLNWENVLKARQEISNLKAQKDEILSRIGLNESQMQLLAAQCGLTEMQAYRLAQLLPHEIMNMDANTALMSMNTQLSQEQILSIDRDIMHVNFVERLEREKFDFDKGAWGVEQEKWQKEYRKDAILHTEDNLIRLFTFGVGAAALRNGEALPRVVTQRSGAGGHYGNTRSYGSNGNKWNTPENPWYRSRNQ